MDYSIIHHKGLTNRNHNRENQKATNDDITQELQFDQRTETQDQKGIMSKNSIEEDAPCRLDS